MNIAISLTLNFIEKIGTYSVFLEYFNPTSDHYNATLESGRGEGGGVFVNIFVLDLIAQKN